LRAPGFALQTQTIGGVEQPDQTLRLS